MKKYLVIGNPINHSLSPQIHNYWLKENHINATYDKLNIENNEIKSLIADIKQKKIAGCNVTVPFKKAVIPYLDKLSLEAEQTQSVNTIVFENKKLVGYNTDVIGFTKAIENLNFNIKDKKIFILGAGGVAPSIIFALNKMKVSQIAISNRTREKAENLKVKFKNLKIIEWGNLEDFDIIILDPPAFAKHIKSKNKAVQGYKRLNTRAIEKVKSGGLIFTFSCSQVIDNELFKHIILSASIVANRKVSILHQLHQPLDHPVNIYHPESEYLKGLVIKVY